MIAPQVNPGSAADALGFARIDSFRRYAERGAAPRLDLDEYQCLMVGRDQIDFRAGGTKITLEYAIAAAPQMARGNFLSAASQRDALAPRQLLVPAIEIVADTHPPISKPHS